MKCVHSMSSPFSINGERKIYRNETSCNEDALKRWEYDGGRILFASDDPSERARNSSARFRGLAEQEPPIRNTQNSCAWSDAWP